MNIKQIRGFVELSKTLNFSRTAEKMYMSQPAFSRMIESLEKELGVKLIVRDKVHPKMTPAGQQVLKYMLRILNEYSDMMDSVQRGSDVEGELTIGVLEDGVRANVLQIVKPFMKKYPQVIVNFQPLRESSAFEDVLEGRVDCAILVHFPPIYQDQLVGDIVSHTQTCVVMNKNHPLADRESLSLSELKDEGFIIIDESQSRFGFNRTMGMCLQYGFAPNIARRVQSVSMALSAIELDYGIMILHDSMKDIAGPETVFIPLAGEPEVAVWCIRKPDNTGTAVLEFSEFIQENIVQSK